MSGTILEASAALSACGEIRAARIETWRDSRTPSGVPTRIVTGYNPPLAREEVLASCSIDPVVTTRAAPIPVTALAHFLFDRRVQVLTLTRPIAFA